MMSLLPVLIAGGLTVLLGWLYWQQAVAAVRATLDGWLLVGTLMQWLDSIGASALRHALAPLVVVAFSVPAVVVFSLLLVALLMTPAVSRLVAARRFPTMHRRRGGTFLASVGVSVGCTALALLALVLSIPLWLIPPMILVVPPLIWGWLTYRVMTFDVLAEFADAQERHSLMREHRWPLLAIGVVSGYLGAAPSLLWAFSAATLMFAPLLIVASVWLYTLVFAFSALWFAHYALSALDRLRRPAAPAPAGVINVPPPQMLPPVY